MGNRDLLIGSTFLEQSLYEIGRLQAQRLERAYPKYTPSSFKIFQQTEFYALSQAVPLTSGDARWSFPTYAREHQPSPRLEVLEIEQLSTLLYYTYGFSRYDTGPGVAWPFHRFVASARCLFPTELYLWLPQTAHIPAGIYHYDALHHGLALIRPGHAAHIIGAAVDTDLRGCLAILFFSSLFWKTAYKYTNFAYRLCTQEAGMVAGNTLLVAGALGLQGRVHYQFLDHVLNRLPGFEPGEESMLAIMPLYPGNEAPDQNTARLWQEHTASAMLGSIPPLQLAYNKANSLTQELCAQMIELDRHTFLEKTSEIVTQPAPVYSDCVLTEERIAPLPLMADAAELVTALSRRSSGDVDFTPSSLPLQQNRFWESVRFALSEYHNDLSPSQTSPRLQLYIVINAVTGLDQGIYRFCAGCGMLHVVERGDFTLLFQAAQTKGNINSAAANMLCLLVGDYESASDLFGNRAYRILNLEAGIIGQRICIMSAAHGLVARYSNSYDVVQCRTLLRLTSSSLVPFAELVIGYESLGVRVGERYKLHLRG